MTCLIDAPLFKFQVPNGIGTILGAVQLSLFLYYERKDTDHMKEPLISTEQSWELLRLKALPGKDYLGTQFTGFIFTVYYCILGTPYSHTLQKLVLWNINV